MARWAVETRGASIRQACADFMISQTCYRYQPKLSDENAVIVDWLVRLTYNQKNWGFGLCFLHLRNVKGFGWNHKRVYRIYRELELNLRIKPKKRIVREKPQPLAVPDAVNQVWSMDFMHDQLSDGRSFRLFNEQFLQAGVLGFEFFQTLGVRNTHSAELGSPEVVAGFRETVPAAQFLDRQPGFRLPQEANDLFFGETLLHVQLLE